MFTRAPIERTTEPFRRSRNPLRRRARVATLLTLLVCLDGIGCRTRPFHFGESPTPRRVSEVHSEQHAVESREQPPPNGRHSVRSVSLAIGDPARLPNRRVHIVRDLRELEMWDLTLAEANFIALSNCRLVRTTATFLSPNNPLYSNPDQLSSIYDPAIQSTGYLYGQLGEQAALSAFDTQWNTSSIWGRNETVQNNRFLSGGLRPGATLIQETAIFSTELRKQMRTGGQVALVHDWNYDSSNRTDLLFPSVYTGDLRAEFRQPLLAGFGPANVGVTGPISNSLQGVTGISQGVLIAAINSEISVVDLTLNVGRLVREVETLYWQLAVAHRNYASAAANLEQVQATRTLIENRERANATGGGLAEASEIRESSLQLSIQKHNALSAIYTAEANLRRLLGLSLDDPRLIRPADHPVEAELLVDWESSLSLALVKRAELRRQQLNVRSLEMQLRAAESLLRPRLDFVSGYRVNGFGDQLLANTRADGLTQQGYKSAYSTLVRGDETGWNLGFEYSVPLGYRLAQTRVQNARLRLAKARAVLREQEAEVTFELAAAYRDVERSWIEAAFHKQRLENSRQRLAALDSQYRVKGDTATLLALTNAQQTAAQAELAWYTSLVHYTEAQDEIQYRMGSLLELNQIQLADEA